jgi:uncharacterized membrane protein YciS (DUF1049 family)
MQTFILISVAIFAIFALVNEISNSLSIKVFPEIVSQIAFYISTVLGIIYVSKILWILLVLDFIHAGNVDAWNKYKYYRTFDHVVCISGFLYQLYIVYLNIIS